MQGGNLKAVRSQLASHRLSVLDIALLISCRVSPQPVPRLSSDYQLLQNESRSVARLRLPMWLPLPKAQNADWRNGARARRWLYAHKHIRLLNLCHFALAGDLCALWHSKDPRT